MNVLLTGFDPFGGESVNPSWEVAKLVAAEGVGKINIQARQLPTVFQASIEEVQKELALLKPDLIISLGQAGGRPSISLERVAINLDDARIADNAGNQPEDLPIVEGGPAAYFSTLPVKQIQEKLLKNGIPASISDSAGTFVCNHVMYGTLHHLALQQLPVKAGFIHIPYLPSQAVQHRNAPSMSLQDMVRAIKLAIEVSLFL